MQERKKNRTKEEGNGKKKDKKKKKNESQLVWPVEDFRFAVDFIQIFSSALRYVCGLFMSLDSMVIHL